MEASELKRILDEKNAKWTGDNAYQGLQIIAKYINPANTDIIGGAEHDVFYSVSLDKICKAGITQEDAEALAALNWMEEEGYLACFV